MDGYEATAATRRQSGAAARIPVIAMTAGVMEADRDRCVAAGMDDFVARPITIDRVAKPITIDRVEGVLRRWVGLESTSTGVACPVA